jgi:hypothetical protein
MYAKVAWARVAEFVEINTYLVKALSKALMKLGVLGTSFIDKIE